MNSKDIEDSSRSVGIDTKCEEDNFSYMKEITAEVNAWTKKEKDLDDEIKCLREALHKEPVVTDKDIMEQLHLYNDMKDAAQVVLGSLARIEEVSFTELHKRYNLEISDGP